MLRLCKSQMSFLTSNPLVSKHFYCRTFTHMVLTQKHATISSIGNGVDMRRNFMTLLPLVQFDNFIRVDRQTLVRVNDDAEQSRVGLHTIFSSIFVYYFHFFKIKLAYFLELLYTKSLKRSPKG